MRPRPRIVLILGAAGALAVPALGQAQPAKEPAAAPAQAQAKPDAKQAALTPAQLARRRSIVHHYPYPYPAFYYEDTSAGFRNGPAHPTVRYRDYYPPTDRLEMAPSVNPIPVATFGGGGVPTLADQRDAQRVGVMKDSMMMQHIDNYARPAFGYGLGVGFFGGFN